MLEQFARLGEAGPNSEPLQEQPGQALVPRAEQCFQSMREQQDGALDGGWKRKV